jgi:hypothetical protein
MDRTPEEWIPQPHRRENFTSHNTNQSWVNLLFPNRFIKLGGKNAILEISVTVKVSKPVIIRSHGQ